MSLILTEKYRNFRDSIDSKFIEIICLNSNISSNSGRLDLKTRAKFMGEELTNLSYNNPSEKYLDVLNINDFYFHAWLEVDNYASQIEVNIEKVYANLTLLNYDAGLWFDSQPEEDKALWKTFRPFDTRPEIGDNKMAVFSIQEGVSPPNEPAIYYLDRATAFKTNLTFVQYFETVLDMIGIADWQLLFADISWNDPDVDYYYPELKASLEALAKVFPEKDYTKYFELLESKWDK